MKVWTTAAVAAGVIGPMAWVAAGGGAAAGSGWDDGAAAVGGAVPAPEGFEWFWAINGPIAADGGSDLSADEDGNVFLAGEHGGLDLDGDGEVELTSGATVYQGARNPLFMKLSRGPDDERVRLRWVRSPRTPADRSQTRVAADGRGGVFVSGSFMESLAFEDGPTLQGAGGNDAFIARYDGEGGLTWARVFGGPEGGDAIYGLASDRDGRAYVVGTASGAFALDEAGAEFRSETRVSVLVAYGPDGRVRWHHRFEVSTPFVFHVRVAPDGGVYVSGELEDATDFDGDGVTDLPRPRDRDGFVARFDAEGGFQGAWALPSPVALAFGPERDLIVAAPISPAIAERYGPADFDGDGRPDVTPSTSDGTGAWVARYGADGARRWVRANGLAGVSDLEVRGDQIVLAGNYTGVRDLDEDGESEPVDRTVDPSIETDLAILVLSAQDGRPRRVWGAPGPGRDQATAVAFLPWEASLVTTGYIQLTADFTGDGEAGEGWALCENLGDLFFAQYHLEPEAPAVLDDGDPITLAVSPVQGDARWRIGLTWSGARGSEVDVLQDGQTIATVANSGSHTVLIPLGDFAPPYAYQVCETGGGRCSPTRQVGS